MKKRIFLIAIVTLTLLFSVSCNTDNQRVAHYTKGTLYTNEDWMKTVYMEGEDFVILNLTDIQLGANSYLKSYKEIFAMISDLVSEVKPNLITVTGDFSYGNSLGFYGICSFINSFDIPWAPVYGNHDFNKSEISPLTEAEAFCRYSNCLFAKGPELLAIDEESGFEAYGNYVVNIVDRQSNKTVRSLIFMNSMQKGISNLQQDWYSDCIDSLPKDTPSSVFMHIPVYGFRQANYWATKDISEIPGTIEESYDDKYWNDGFKDSFGICTTVYISKNDDGFRAVMEGKKSTDLIVCGHYHRNCSCVKYKGITYLYGLKTGSGNSYNEEMCGGTSITINKNGFNIEHILKPLKSE